MSELRYGGQKGETVWLHCLDCRLPDVCPRCGNTGACLGVVIDRDMIIKILGIKDDDQTSTAYYIHLLKKQFG